MRRLKTVVVLMILMLCTAANAEAQRIRRTLSPDMLLRVAAVQSFSPSELRTLAELYKSTGWEIALFDDDPSDGEMAIWATQNMSLAMDDFVSNGHPCNGVKIHFTQHDGFKADRVFVAFDGEEQKSAFVRELIYRGFVCDEDPMGENAHFSNRLTPPGHGDVDVSITMDIVAGLPTADIVLTHE